MESADEIARLITEWRAEVSEQAQRFDAASRAIDEVSVTETAAGGAIVVTVASSGIPTDLRLGDDVGRMKPDQIAAQIMSCLRRAQARLADRVGTVVADTVGDAAGGQAIVEEYQHRFPPLSDMEEELPAPAQENAAFGLSDVEAQPPARTAIQAFDRPDFAGSAVTATAPTRVPRRPPASNDDADEDWDSPW